MTYDGNEVLGRVFRALDDGEVYDGKHTAVTVEDGKLLHTVTWTQRPSPAGT